MTEAPSCAAPAFRPPSCDERRNRLPEASRLAQVHFARFSHRDGDRYQRINERDLQLLRAFLDGAHGRGLKIVLTMFSLPGGRGKSDVNDPSDGRIWHEENYQEQAFAFWRDLARNNLPVSDPRVLYAMHNLGPWNFTINSGGRFHRAVRLDNQIRKDVKIEVVQAGRDPERTSVTGLRHVDGGPRWPPPGRHLRLFHLRGGSALARLRRLEE